MSSSNDIPADAISTASALNLDSDPDLAEELAQVSSTDFECALCCSLLYDPVTTNDCGHSFCRLCLHRSLEVTHSCPICRTPCSLDALSHPTSSLIANLAQKLFSKTYAARKIEVGQEMTRRVKAPRYGIFQSSGQPLFPGSPIQLHIFEPKYRVMISRALQGTRNFIFLDVDESRGLVPAAPVPGMVGEGLHGALGGAEVGDVIAAAQHANLPVPLDAQAQQQVAAQVAGGLQRHPFDAPSSRRLIPIIDGDIGVLVKILRSQAHADGRFFVEAVGVDRVKIKRPQKEDEAAFGLVSAEVEVIRDLTAEQEAAATASAAAEENNNSSSTASVGASSSSSIEETKNDANTSEGLRRRHTDSSSSSSSASSSASSAAAEPVEVPAALSNEDLIRECRRLLVDYCHMSGLSMDRLALIHGGPCPDDAHPAEFSWWVLRAMPENAILKHQGLVSTSLNQRLTICVELIRASIEFTQYRTNNQVKFVGILILLAVIMIFLNKNFG